MPPPPGYNTTSNGVKRGTTGIPPLTQPAGGSLCGGEATGGATRNGSPASSFIRTMKPRKPK